MKKVMLIAAVLFSVACGVDDAPLGNVRDGELLPPGRLSPVTPDNGVPTYHGPPKYLMVDTCIRRVPVCLDTEEVLCVAGPGPKFCLVCGCADMTK